MGLVPDHHNRASTAIMQVVIFSLGFNLLKNATSVKHNKAKRYKMRYACKFFPRKFH